MKNIKNWLIYVLALGTSFSIDFNWFNVKNICDLGSSCPDYLGLPIYSFPNFYVNKICGGLTGQCVPAHFSISVFIFDIIIASVLFIIIRKLISLMFKK